MRVVVLVAVGTDGRTVVAMAVGTANVKQKEKRKTNHLFTWMGGRQYGRMNGCSSGHLCV